MKTKLLVVELWGVGDLAIATPFLQAASEQYEVTLLAKPYALDMQRRFWPAVRVVPCVVPWTAFQRKYRLLTWPWGNIFRLWRALRRERFDVALSARWDPRDHLLLRLVGARERIGFARMGSAVFLSRALARPEPAAHRCEHWRALAGALRWPVPPRAEIPVPAPRGGPILVHTGAGQAVRVWPLERYRDLVRRLRARHWPVEVACDPDQRDWWLRAGEGVVATPRTVGELLALVDRAGAFLGNDSGPGHLAAFCGVPTLTIFGPQLAEWFMPLHPQAQAIEGKPCPYKPCSDYCRFKEPYCLTRLTVEEVAARAEVFVAGLAGVRGAAPPADPP